MHGMRRLLTIALTAVALLAVAALAGVGRPEVAGADTAAPDTVTTTGHGVVVAVPDEASITAGVHTQAASASTALSKAGGDARAKAEALAKAGGFGVGQVSTVTEDSGGAPVPMFQAATVKADSTTIEAGTRNVTADVTVSFRIR